MKLHASILSQIPGTDAESEIRKLSGGLINHTLEISSRDGRGYILQQINTSVFPEPENLAANHRVLWNYLQENPGTVRIPEPLPFRNGAFIVQDEDGNSWRLMEFISGTNSLLSAELAEQAEETAETFAAFSQSFAALDAGLLKPSIAGFHDLRARYEQFLQAEQNATEERKNQADGMIRFLKARERYVKLFDYIRSSGLFPLRVQHHDAKIANILFEEKTGKIAAIVDLDTTMPGYFFSDPGDMIRSMVCPFPENNAELMSIFVRPDFYEAIVNPYLEKMEEVYTEKEKEFFHYGGLLMIYMQALRFGADFLNGDIYYPVTYQTQNFDRAMNQLTLLVKLEDLLKRNNLLPEF